MGLNRSKGNMYGFINYTFNTVKGKCPHNCSYCYMKRYPQSELHFDEKELKTNLGKGNYIFVGSSCDMFADKIPDVWIKKTIEYCNWYFENKYFFQSKNPQRFLNFIDDFPIGSIFCTTIETNYNRYNYGKAPSFQERVFAIHDLSYSGYKTMITIEPIIDFDLDKFIKILTVNPVSQINIGADSSREHNLPEPSRKKVLKLIKELENAGISVHQKPNLARIIRGNPIITERGGGINE